MAALRPIASVAADGIFPRLDRACSILSIYPKVNPASSNERVLRCLAEAPFPEPVREQGQKPLAVIVTARPRTRLAQVLAGKAYGSRTNRAWRKVNAVRQPPCSRQRPISAIARCG